MTFTSTETAPLGYGSIVFGVEGYLPIQDLDSAGEYIGV